MRIMKMELGKPLTDLVKDVSRRKFIYKKISSSIKDDLYLYQIKYKSSGLIIDVMMNSSEALWLMSFNDETYRKKFERAMDIAFISFVRTSENFYKKTKEE